MFLNPISVIFSMKSLEAKLLKALGDVYIANNDYYQASLCYNLSTKYETNAEQLFYAGLAYYHVAENTKNSSYYERAYEYFSKCLQIDNSFYEASFYIALILIKLGNPTRAGEILLNL